jgi:uncharacterized protein (TIGR02466 family)
VNGFIKIMNGSLKILIMTGSNDIGVINPHSNYIFKLHFDFDWDLLAPFCHELISTTPKGLSLVTNGHTSHQNKKQPHRIKEFKPYFDWLHFMVAEVAKNGMGYSKSYHEYKVTNSWVNVHEKGGVTSTHNHSNTFLVAAAYLKMPENGGYFECKDPLEYVKGEFYYDDPNWMWKEIPTVTGDVLIFPSWLRHRTQVNNSNEKRWVLTSNFSQEFNPQPFYNGQ